MHYRAIYRSSSRSRPKTTVKKAKLAAAIPAQQPATTPSAAPGTAEPHVARPAANPALSATRQATEKINKLRVVSSRGPSGPSGSVDPAGKVNLASSPQHANGSAGRLPPPTGAVRHLRRPPPRTSPGQLGPAGAGSTLIASRSQLTGQDHPRYARKSFRSAAYIGSFSQTADWPLDMSCAGS